MPDSSPLKSRVQEDMKTAMRAQDKNRLGTIRLFISEIKRKEIDERIELTDADVLGVLNKMIKQRRESIAQFESAQRADLVTKETDELHVLQAYLPQQISADEAYKLIAEAIQTANASSAKDMGSVMAILKPKLQGRFDIAEASKLVRSKLGA